MNLQRILQINMAVLVALGALLLDVGQRNGSMALLTLVAVIVSLVVTDINRWFRLNQLAANVAAIGVSIFFVRNLVILVMVPVLAFANWLIYLQIVLLFQEKKIRTYWQLAVLSLLQVVVASALAQEFWFGLLLVLYLFVCLGAMTLLFQYHERARFQTSSDKPEKPSGKPDRWPLINQEAFFLSSPGNIFSRAGIGWELGRGLLRTGFRTLLIGLLIFVTFPRLNGGGWNSGGSLQKSTVGFSDQVTLEDDTIIELPTEVLRVWFEHESTGKPFEVLGSVYLRGASLHRYREGQWFGPGRYGRQQNVNRLPAASLPPDDRRVLQTITIEPSDRPELFAVWPFANVTSGQTDLSFNERRRRITRSRSMIASQFTYHLATTALVGGSQNPLIPCTNEPDLARLLDIDRLMVPTLVSLSEEWLRGARVDDDDQIGKARQLVWRLRDSGRFTYTLSPPKRNPSLDPIEDFVSVHSAGHCEYFASALVLMLRSQGIPARMIVGYTTVEWNSLGGYFQVRQSDAHTWVEAYIEPGQLPPGLFQGKYADEWQRGGWLRLDPTPGDDSELPGSLAEAVARPYDWLQYVWANYVMGMDGPQQRRAVYTPLAAAVRQAWRSLLDREWWGNLFSNIRKALSSAIQTLTGGQWISWRGGLVAVVAMLLLAACFHALRFGGRLLLTRFLGREGTSLDRPVVRIAFYRRLEKVLDRYGLTRSISQTHREFALEAGQSISGSTGQDRLGNLPSEVAEAFYRVRFGGEPLDKPGQLAVEQALKRLEHAAENGHEASRKGEP